METCAVLVFSDQNALKIRKRCLFATFNVLKT